MCVSEKNGSTAQIGFTGKRENVSDKNSNVY